MSSEKGCRAAACRCSKGRKVLALCHPYLHRVGLNSGSNLCLVELFVECQQRYRHLFSYFISLGVSVNHGECRDRQEKSDMDVTWTKGSVAPLFKASEVPLWQACSDNPEVSWMSWDRPRIVMEAMKSLVISGSIHRKGRLKSSKTISLGNSTASP